MAKTSRDKLRAVEHSVTSFSLGERDVSRRSVCLGTVATAAAYSLAAEAALAYSLAPEMIVDGVWVIRGAQETPTGANGGAIANIGIIKTNAGAVVIDTGPSKRYGEALRGLAHELTGKDIARVYLTHFHPDHVFGNQAFPAERIAASKGVLDGLSEFGDAFATNMYAAVGDWMRGTEVALPGNILTSSSEDFGDRTMRLMELSGHTASDLAILDEKSGVLFTGDLAFLDRAPTTPHADLAVWRESLSRLDGLSFRSIVPGHGPVTMDNAPIRQTREWLAVVEETIRRAFEDGRDITEALAMPLPEWTEALALARYEYQRSVMHLYPQLEKGLWPRTDAVNSGER